MSANDAEKGHIEHIENVTLPDSRVLPPVVPTPIADPVALGFFSFAAVMFVSSMYNAHAKSITEPNMVVGMSLFSGGLTQLLAGMWEFPRGNTFGATAFTMSGAFWFAYATIFIPGFGIANQFEDHLMFENAIGVFHTTWIFVTFCLLVGSFRTSVGLVAFFFMLDLTFILLAIGAFTGKIGVTKAAGITGVVTSFVAFYDGLSSLIGAERKPLFHLPIYKFAMHNHA